MPSLTPEAKKAVKAVCHLSDHNYLIRVENQRLRDQVRDLQDQQAALDATLGKVRARLVELGDRYNRTMSDNGTLFDANGTLLERIRTLEGHLDRFVLGGDHTDGPVLDPDVANESSANESSANESNANVGNPIHEGNYPLGYMEPSFSTLDNPIPVAEPVFVDGTVQELLGLTDEEAAKVEKYLDAGEDPAPRQGDKY